MATTECPLVCVSASAPDPGTQVCLGEAALAARITRKVAPLLTVFEEEAQCGELSALGCAEEWCDAVHVGHIEFGSSLQQQLTDVHVVATDGFLQRRPALKAARVHRSAVLQQHRHHGGTAALAGCKERAGKGRTGGQREDGRVPLLLPL